MHTCCSTTAAAPPACIWPPPIPTFDTTSCAACAAVYPYAAWTSLALVRRIESAEIARLVVEWPSGVSIDVRRCAKCGAPIARKQSARAT
jgi:hypothetical protein